jgi:hypothetical protein
VWYRRGCKYGGYGYCPPSPLIASALRFFRASTIAGFFYHVTDPEQPLTTTYPYPYFYNVAPITYNAVPAVQPYVSGCTNYLGLTVPCYIGGAPVALSAVPEVVAEADQGADPELAGEDVNIRQDVPAIVEARKKRNAEAINGDGGQYPYPPYLHPLRYHTYGGGCRNYLGSLVPCAGR